MASPYLLRGRYVVIGKAPDGDSMRFIPDSPDELPLLSSADRIRISGDGSVQLRFEGVDALHECRRLRSDGVHGGRGEPVVDRRDDPRVGRRPERARDRLRLRHEGAPFPSRRRLGGRLEHHHRPQLQQQAPRRGRGLPDVVHVDPDAAPVPPPGRRRPRSCSAGRPTTCATAPRASAARSPTGSPTPAGTKTTGS